MTRSKLRKIRSNQAKKSRVFLTGVPLASAMLVGAPVVQAQQAEEQSSGLDEVVVTALKTRQNLQDVPVSIQAIGTERLEELNISSFDDYVKYLPSVSYQSAGPGFARVFMRGAAAGDNGNHSGPQPGVGQYLDEQPITTIQGALDIHMYDIARVEALAGPQGTLYGASSQAGTIRIITNRPDPSGFEAGYGLEGNIVDGNDSGYTAEGFVNVPIGDQAAIRLVGWYREDAGWVDNVRATRTFPGTEFVPDDPDAEEPNNLCGQTIDCSLDDITINNDEFAEDDYNTIETYGARAALRVDLN